MADDLDPVEQQFIADVQPYVDAVESAARDVKDFADANREATGAVDDMRDHTAETARAMSELRDNTEEAARADDELRDSAYEAGTALGHMRDEAAEAAEAEKHLDDHTASMRDELDKSKESLDHVKESLDGWKERLDKSKESLTRVHESLGHVTSGIGSLTSKLGSLLHLGGGSGGGGLIGKLLFGANKGLEDAGNAAGSGAGGLPLIGGLGGEGGGGGLAALAVAVPVIEAALVEVTGLVSGFAAAGLGAGAFAVLAVPAFDKVKTAYTNVTAAQTAYHKAQLTEQMDPTKANAAAVSKALLALKESWHGLDPAERGAVHGIQDFMATYKRMVKAFEPDAFKIFNDGLKIANQLLPDVLPFAKTFSNALDGLLQRVGKFAGSKGFKDWLGQFHKLEGPSITAIGDGIGKVANAIGKLLTTMSAKDDVHAINIAFDILAGTIRGLSWTVAHLMHSWDELTSGFRHSNRDASIWAHDVSHDFDVVRHAVADFAHNVASYFDEARANIARWAGDVNRDVNRVQAYFRALPGRVLAALAHLAGDLFNLGRNIIDGLLRGIESAAGGLLGEVEHLASNISGAFSKVLGILSPSRVFHEHGQMIIQGLINGVRAKAPELLALMRDVGGQTGTHFGTGGGGSAAAPSVHVNVPVTLGAGAGGYNDPRFLQYLQGVVQEAVLRYTQVNPSNGLRLAGKIS